MFLSSLLTFQLTSGALLVPIVRKDDVNTSYIISLVLKTYDTSYSSQLGEELKRHVLNYLDTLLDVVYNLQSLVFNK